MTASSAAGRGAGWGVARRGAGARAVARGGAAGGGVTRRGALAGAAALSLGVLGACAPGSGGAPPGSQADKPQEIEYWHGWSGPLMTGSEGMIPKVIGLFNEKYPKVTVNALSVPWNDIPAKLTATVAAGTPPDVVMVANGSGVLYSYAQNGLIQPLEKVASPADLRRLKDWVLPAIWDLGVYNGKVYGLAMWTQSYGLYYNKAHFREAGLDPERGPQTLDELATVAERLTKRDPGAPGGYVRLGFYDDWYKPWVAVFGGQYVDEAGRKITANAPPNVRMLEWFAGWFRRYDAERIAAFRASFSGIPGGAFVNEKYSIIREGPWQTRSNKINAPNLDYGVSFLPLAPDQPQLGCFTYGDIPTVPTGSKQADGAWKYVQFLTGITDQAAVAEMHMYQPQTPTSEKGYRAGAFKKVSDAYPGYDLFARALFEAKRFLYPPKIPTAGTYGVTFDKYVTEARNGTMTAKEALDRVTQESQAELDAAPGAGK